MSAGTGTSLVASRPTSVSGTSIASTAASASGSAPTFHSTPSAGLVSPRSMLPGASIVPAMAWMPASREANDGSSAAASATFVNGPTVSSVTGSVLSLDRRRSSSGAVSSRAVSPVDRRQVHAVERVGAGAPLGREPAAVDPRILATARDRDVRPAEGRQEPARVAEAGHAVHLAGGRDRHGAEVDGGIAEHGQQREHVVRREVRIEDHGQRVARRSAAGRSGVTAGEAADGDRRPRALRRGAGDGRWREWPHARTTSATSGEATRRSQAGRRVMSPSCRRGRYGPVTAAVDRPRGRTRSARRRTARRPGSTGTGSAPAGSPGGRRRARRPTARGSCR